MSITATEPKQYASESGHFYMPDGTPFYDVPNKSKPGETRPATLRDARKVGAVPGVSTILKVADKPGLRRYLDRMMFEATYTTPRLDGETDDEHFRRCKEWADEHSRLAREKGTDIHGAIENRMLLRPTAPEMLPFIEAAQSALDEIGISEPTSVCAEKSFAHELGYGGKIDLSGPDFVVDFKTKGNWTDADVKRGLAYEEHGMQLVAYAHGLKLVTYAHGMQLASPRLLNVFISTDEPGKYHVHEWPKADHERLWDMFRHLLGYWQLVNDYRP